MNMCGEAAYLLICQFECVRGHKLHLAEDKRGQLEGFPQGGQFAVDVAHVPLGPEGVEIKVWKV